jgi:hypothetical protein
MVATVDKKRANIDNRQRFIPLINPLFCILDVPANYELIQYDYNINILI